MDLKTGVVQSNFLVSAKNVQRGQVSFSTQLLFESSQDEPNPSNSFSR